MVTVKFWRSAAALAAASLLVVGCGSEEGGNGTLSRSEANAVLPDSDAMSGWDKSAGPGTTASKGAYESKVCPGDTAEACEGVRSYGSAQYTSGDKTLLSSFQVITYRDEESAETAYDLLWKRYRTLADAHELDLAGLGEESDARVGKGGYGGQDAAVYQIRVGPLVLFGTAKSSTAESRLDEATVQKLATMFTDRAGQAADGEEPSAGLQDQ